MLDGGKNGSGGGGKKADGPVNGGIGGNPVGGNHGGPNEFDIAGAVAGGGGGGGGADVCSTLDNRSRRAERSSVVSNLLLVGIVFLRII